MKNVKTLLSHLVGNQNTLSTNVLFIDFTGSHEKAQLLSQMFYWSSRTKREDGFFAKSHKEWFDEVRIKRHSLMRHTKVFVKMGFLETKVEKFKGYPTTYYRLNQDKLINQLVAFCNNRDFPLSQSATLESINLQQTKECSTVQQTIYRDYTETTTESSAHDQEKEKQSKAKKLTSPKQPKIETDWKPAANAIILDKDAVTQIKQDADLKPSQKVGPFAKDYFLHLKAKGDFYRLKIPQSESERWSWRAKHIAGITQWIIRENKFYPKRKEKQSEPVPPCYTNTFDYSILENRS